MHTYIYFFNFIERLRTVFEVILLVTTIYWNDYPYLYVIFTRKFLYVNFTLDDKVQYILFHL